MVIVWRVGVVRVVAVRAVRVMRVVRVVRVVGVVSPPCSWPPSAVDRRSQEGQHHEAHGARRSSPGRRGERRHGHAAALTRVQSRARARSGCTASCLGAVALQAGREEAPPGRSPWSGSTID